MDEILSRTRIDLAKPILSVLKINLDPSWRELGESYFNAWLRSLKASQVALYTYSTVPCSPCFQY